MHPSLFHVTSPFHYACIIRVQKNIVKSSCGGGGGGGGCVWVIRSPRTIKDLIICFLCEKYCAVNIYDRALFPV